MLNGANVSITAIGAGGNGGLLSMADTTVNTPGTQTTQTDIANTSHRGDWAWQAAKGQGSSDQTTNYNQFHVAQFNVGTLATPVNRVEVGLGAKDSISALAQQPGMGWIAQINSDPALAGKVDWAKVEEAHTNWHYSQQGLTPEAAAVVTLVVAYFTAGAASGAGATAGNAAAVTAGGGATGATISTVVGGAVTAGISALAGQATVALINNKGDIGGALDDLGSSASVKGMLTAIVTGGVLGGLNLNPTGLPTSGAGAQGFMTQLGQNLQAAAARAVIGTAINGGSLEDSLKLQLKTAFIDTFAAQVAHQIGDWTQAGTLDGFTNKIAHAIAGCAIGAAKAESASGCGAGALGAAIGELSAELYGTQIDTVQFASMMAGIAAAIAGGDAAAINLASQTGANAAANNYLKHIDVEKLEKKLKECRDNTACRDQAFDEAYRKSLANDIELLNCQSTNNCDVLKAEFRRGYAAIEDMLGKGIQPADVSLILGMETNAQTIIRNGLDKLNCSSVACVERANYLVGLGKGLAKVTPVGLVTGSGVMAYELTTALLNYGLTDTAIAVVQGVAGLPADLQQRLGSNDPQVRGEALVDALAIGTVATVVTTKLTQNGYGTAMRRVEAKALAAKEAETIATRMREVAIHADDARFSEVAQTIVAAEKAGWKTADGKTWWPPENGKVPGTEQIVELKAGQKLDRYGGTGKNSTFLAPADTPVSQRALPDSTNLAVRDEYIVLKPFKVEESRVMPWFGKDGMGIQYETSTGSKMTIEQLVRDEYIKKVVP